MKVDKTKLLEVSGGKRTTFDRLMSQMETVIQTLTGTRCAERTVCWIVILHVLHVFIPLWFVDVIINQFEMY